MQYNIHKTIHKQVHNLQPSLNSLKFTNFTIQINSNYLDPNLTLLQI